MEQERRPKLTLSKNLRLMKFMQRTTPVKKEESAKEDSHWYFSDEEPSEEQRIRQRIGYVSCENLLPIGRMSFKNFNPTVEKLYHELLENKTSNEEEKDTDEEDVSEEEMVRRYDTLVDTVHKKFSNKRKRPSEEYESPGIQKRNKNDKKHKFLKPKED